MPRTKFEETLAFAAHLMAARRAREGEWRELARWLAPHRGVFTGEDLSPSGSRRNRRGFTSAAISALSRGASGITSGMTPRNSSWFKPDYHDPEMGEAPGARIWADRLDSLMKDCLANGGFYQAIHSFNTDLLWAGCAMLYAESSPHSVLRFECVQVGTFHVALNGEGQLDAALRSMAMSPARMAQLFGVAALGEDGPEKLKNSPYQPERVWHLVRRRDYGNPGRLDRASMPYESLFWREGGKGFLEDGGFHEMPYFFTSWHEGPSPYGTGPGDDALPDARQMDLLERRKLESLATINRPPLQAPTLFKEIPDLSPGGLTHLPRESMDLIRPIIDLSPHVQSLSFLQAEIQNLAQRLDQELMAAIFTSTPMDQRPRDMSATEFLERKRECLQQLGPVMAAYEPNVLTPLLYRVQGALDRANVLPPLPKALEGYPVATRMEFISPMANALRQNAAETTRALLADVGNLAQISQNPEILDKVDLDQIIDELATGLGAPGKIIRADADVARLREQRAQQAQAQQAAQLQAQQEQMAAQNVKNLAQAAQSAANAGIEL